MLRRSAEDQEERAQARQEAAEAKQHEKDLAEFADSPIGKAFSARAAGDPLFQVELDVQTLSGRSAFGSSGNRTKRNTGTAAVLGCVEEVGWRLDHAGWVFVETGATSTNRIGGTGQGTTTRGKLVGVYLFRSADPAPEWADAVGSGVPPEGWRDLVPGDA